MQTVIAVATESFIRIYDLSQDNFSPKFNISPFEGQITDFTFVGNRIFVASSTGHLFMHELQFDTDSKDNSMQVDQDQSEITLVEDVSYPQHCGISNRE